jgi:hypothetical protein
MTTEQIIEIVQTAHSLGAKSVTISDAIVSIEWKNSVTISSPVYYPPRELGESITDPIAPPTTIYGMGMGMGTGNAGNNE